MLLHYILFPYFYNMLVLTSYTVSHLPFLDFNSCYYLISLSNASYYMWWSWIKKWTKNIVMLKSRKKIFFFLVVGFNIVVYRWWTQHVVRQQSSHDELITLFVFEPSLIWLTLTNTFVHCVLMICSTTNFKASWTISAPLCKRMAISTMLLPLLSPVSWKLRKTCEILLKQMLCLIAPSMVTLFRRGSKTNYVISLLLLLCCQITCCVHHLSNRSHCSQPRKIISCSSK